MGGRWRFLLLLWWVERCSLQRLRGAGMADLVVVRDENGVD